MTRLTAGEFQIDIFSDPDFRRDSADNLHQYNSIYLNEDGYRSTSIFGIKVYKDAELLNSALIGASGGGTGVHPTGMIVEPERLVICCSDSVFSLALPTLALQWKTKTDDATCFEIFKYRSDYIVHGELAVSRLSADGDLIWQQSGADIFTTLNSNEGDFVVTDSYILATDWDNRKYKFDFDGNAIR